MQSGGESGRLFFVVLGVGTVLLCFGCFDFLEWFPALGRDLLFLVGLERVIRSCWSCYTTLLEHLLVNVATAWLRGCLFTFVCFDLVSLR